jgi:hypothetical protein
VLSKNRSRSLNTHYSQLKTALVVAVGPIMMEVRAAGGRRADDDDRSGAAGRAARVKQGRVVKRPVKGEA